MGECGICCEKYNNSPVRKKIECVCGFDCCVTCIKTFILDDINDAKCMSCKQTLGREFLIDNISYAFVDKDYKKHREQLLVDIQMSKMEETQAIIEQEKEINKIREEVNEINAVISNLITEKYKLEENIYNLRTYKTNSIKDKVRFFGHCSVDTCNGFINASWECGICETKVCKTCKERLTYEELLDSRLHECDQALLDTIKHIKSECKPCPKCKISIHRIDGCFEKGTKVLLYDQSLKNVEDIKVGDNLIGIDGNKREVLKTCDGVDEMYKIKQSNGMDYTVNSKHTLILMDQDNKIHEYIIDDYLKLPESTKNRLYGFKSENGVNYKEQKVKLDPYLLGVWLGDGTHNTPEIASNDSEIPELEEKSEFKTNPSMDQLRTYNLVGNKHIPQQYLNNSREVRLQLLAGLIDSDGCVNNKGKIISITQTKPDLSEQIISLARSLGLVVNVTIRERKIKDYKDQYQINISSTKLSEIPTKLWRKKCENSIPNKNPFKSTITVEPIGKGQYFGFMVEKDNILLGKDHTILKNCRQMWCTQCHTSFDWKTGDVVIGNIHNPHFLEWQRKGGGGGITVNENDDNGVCFNAEYFYNIHMGVFERCFKNIDDKDSYKWYFKCIQLMRHIKFYEMPTYNRYINSSDIKELTMRKEYLKNEVTLTEFKRKLQAFDKRKSRNRDYYMIFDMFTNTCCSYIINTLFKNKRLPLYTYRSTKENIHLVNIEDLKELYNIIQKLVDYTNESLLKLKKIYRNKSYAIDKEMFTLISL